MGVPSTRNRQAFAVLALGCLWVIHGLIHATELPQPLSLDDALSLINEQHSAEQVAGEYGDTAIRARAFECRAQDREPADEDSQSGCGFWHLLTPRQQTELDVMRRFLDVVEADLTVAVDNEAMAVAYVRLDRARNREELGQYSPLDVSELDLEYQQIRSHLYYARAQQRATRARLLMAMGQSGSLPSDVSNPDISALPKQLGELDEITQEALKANPVLADWRLRAESDATLRPLLGQLELHLRDAVLTLWLRYPVLLAQLDLAQARDYDRELALDRSRTLYELEAKADLGDAMTNQTAARLARTRTDHRAWMLLATLNALRGKPYDYVAPDGDAKS